MKVKTLMAEDQARPQVVLDAAVVVEPAAAMAKEKASLKPSTKMDRQRLPRFGA